MYKIGLTGGIGSGKSTATELFQKLGITIIDADLIAHQIVQKDQSALADIAAQFGQQILNDDHSLNRAALRKIIFADSIKKIQLEAILHPLIYQHMQKQVEYCNSAYAVLAIPLLLETQRQDFVDRILVIDCPVAIQISRVLKRDQLSEVQIKAIIQTQVPRQQRINAADDIIVNDLNLTTLAEQVKKLHNHYLSLSNFQ